MSTNEAFSRVVIDNLLVSQGWNLTDGFSVRFEYTLTDGKRADYLLCNRNGRGLAVIEAKRSSINSAHAAEQAKQYEQQLGVPYIFLANGNEIRFWDWQNEAHSRHIKTLFKQDDLERRKATREMRVDSLSIPVDKRIVERGYQKRLY